MRHIRKSTCALLQSVIVACVFASGSAIAKSPPADDQIKVTWSDPADFSDLKDSPTTAVGRSKPEQWLEDLAKHLRARAGRRIGADQHLDVTFTDIKRAGTYEPWRGPSFDDIRIVSQLYPPKIDLRFTLTDADGATIASGTRELRDASFLSRGTMSRDDPLRFEKRLLDDWLTREFPERHAARD